MVKQRSIARIVEPQVVREGAGVWLRRSIALPTLDNVDPFLLFDDFRSHNPADVLAGFPMHPHRGIETVTYMLAGNVAHRDSIGNAGVIGPGAVQWMTAGRGILHEEMPQPVEGILEGFQLWVNLPAALKMMPARYQELRAEEIPEATLDGGARVRVITGAIAGARGPVTEIAVQPTYLDVTLPVGAVFALSTPAEHNVLLYLFEGELRMDGETLAATRMLVLGEGEAVEIHSGAVTGRFLFIAGKPLREPIARYGPFVMNTREEIQRTLQELRAGVFPPV